MFSRPRAAVLYCLTLLISSVALADVVIMSNARRIDARAQAGETPLVAQDSDDGFLPWPFVSNVSATASASVDDTGYQSIVRATATMDSSALNVPALPPADLEWTLSGDATVSLLTDMDTAMSVGFDAMGNSYYDVGFQLTDTPYDMEIWWELDAEDGGAGWALTGLESDSTLDGPSDGYVSIRLNEGFYSFSAYAFATSSSAEPVSSSFGTYAIRVVFTPVVPEPATAILLGAALVALASRKRSSTLR